MLKAYLRTLAPTFFLAAYRETCCQLCLSLGDRHQTINDTWLQIADPTALDLKSAMHKLESAAPEIASASRPLEESPTFTRAKHLQFEYTAALEQKAASNILNSYRTAASLTSVGEKQRTKNASQLIRALAVCETGAMSYINVATHERQYRAPNELFTLMPLDDLSACP